MHRPLFASIAALVLSGALSAQQPFVIDGAQTNFTWSGTSSAGPVVGNPSNAFTLVGTVDMDLQPGSGIPSTSGQFTGGDALVTPDIAAKITGAFGITLATIDVTNLRLSFTSGSFAIDAAGNFTGDVVANILSGTLTVVPLIGSTTVSDLTGSASPPTTVSGVVLPAAPCHQVLVFPNLTFMFDFSDPASGITASLTVSGQLVGLWLNPGGETYCTAKSGLTCGTPAISAVGCPTAGATSGFYISAGPARGNRTGLVLYTTNGQNNAPFEGGTLCVATPLKRSTPINSGGTNGACDGVFIIDFNAFATGQLGGNPLPALGVAGTQVNAQIWGRDSLATGSFLSDGLEFLMN